MSCQSELDQRTKHPRVASLHRMRSQQTCRFHFGTFLDAGNVLCSANCLDRLARFLRFLFTIHVTETCLCQDLNRPFSSQPFFA